MFSFFELISQYRYTCEEDGADLIFNFLEKEDAPLIERDIFTIFYKRQTKLPPFTNVRMVLRLNNKSLFEPRFDLKNEVVISKSFFEPLDWQEILRKEKCEKTYFAGVWSDKEMHQKAKVEVFTKDNINPNHYKQGKVECIDALESATIGKSEIEAVYVNIIKYLEDVKKAKWYLDRLIKILGNEK